MNQNKKRTKSKKQFVGITLATLAAAGALAAYIFIAKPFSRPTTTTGTTRPANSVDYGPPSDEQKKAAEQQKEQTLQQNNDGQPTGEPHQSTSTLTVTISRAGQASAGGSTAGQAVNVRVLVTGVSSGDCTFTFSKGGQSNVVKTASISYQATTATCGADIPASDFPAAGVWKLTAKAANGISEGSAEQDVEVAK